MATATKAGAALFVFGLIVHAFAAAVITGAVAGIAVLAAMTVCQGRAWRQAFAALPVIGDAPGQQ